MKHSALDLDALVSLFMKESVITDDKAFVMPEQWLPRSATTLYEISCNTPNGPLNVPLGCIVVQGATSIELVSIEVSFEWFRKFDETAAYSEAFTSTYAALHSILGALASLNQRSRARDMEHERHECTGILHTLHMANALNNELSLGMSRMNLQGALALRYFTDVCTRVSKSYEPSSHAMKHSMMEQRDMLLFFPLIRKAIPIMREWIDVVFKDPELSFTWKQLQQFVEKQADPIKQSGGLTKMRNDQSPVMRELSRLIYEHEYKHFAKLMVGTHTLGLSSTPPLSYPLPYERSEAIMRPAVSNLNKHLKSEDEPTDRVLKLLPELNKTVNIIPKTNLTVSRLQKANESPKKEPEKKSLVFFMPQPPTMQ